MVGEQVKRLLGNLPLILGLSIAIGFSLDIPLLRFMKTEGTYGIWVVVLAPAAVLLLLTQVILWFVCPWTRLVRRSRDKLSS